MGCTYRRGKIWWVKYFRSGRQNFETSGSQKKEDATNLLKLREGDIARGVPVSAKIGRVRFEDARDDLLNDKKNNGRPLKKLKARIANHLTPFFGGRRMANITVADIRAYTTQRKAETVLVHAATIVTLRDCTEKVLPEVRRPVANATINRELTILKRMFSLTVQAGLLYAKPHIALLQEDNTRVGFFEPEQYVSVLARLPAALQPVIQFAYVTGWRITSEVLPLEWRQVDLQGGIVRLDPGTTKNRAGRVFPLTRELRLLLEAQHAEHERLKKAGQIEPWVFFRLVAKGRGGKKEPKPIRAFGKTWKRACTAAGCPGRIPHDLRRTAVRNMVRVGIPERVAMQMTGHKTRSVFERYNIVSEGDLRMAANRLSGCALG